MIGSSLGVLFSSIEMVFIHMDVLMFIGLVTMLFSLELFFAAYNFRWKEVRFLVLICICEMIANIVVGMYLILMREDHCQVAYNFNQCFIFSAIYGVVIIVCGAVIYGLSAVLAYYFYRLFSSNEVRGLRSMDNHIFDENDLLKEIEDFDRIKKPSDIHMGNQIVQSPIAVL
ncbi:hypothetical protein WA171_006468, partial [Blastocystis sp. BT1]